MRGPYGTTDALSRLRLALRPSNPHAEDNAITVARSGVIAPLVALFLTGVTSPTGQVEGGARGKVGPGAAALAEAALDVCAELSRSAETHAALIFIGVVDALPHLLELEVSKNGLFEPFDTEDDRFYQDRLGTNIGKVEQKGGVSCRRLKWTAGASRERRGGVRRRCCCCGCVGAHRRRVWTHCCGRYVSFITD